MKKLGYRFPHHLSLQRRRLPWHHSQQHTGLVEPKSTSLRRVLMIRESLSIVFGSFFTGFNLVRTSAYTPFLVKKYFLRITMLSWRHFFLRNLNREGTHVVFAFCASTALRKSAMPSSRTSYGIALAHSLFDDESAASLIKLARSTFLDIGLLVELPPLALRRSRLSSLTIARVSLEALSLSLFTATHWL